MTPTLTTGRHRTPTHRPTSPTTTDCAGRLIVGRQQTAPPQQYWSKDDTMYPNQPGASPDPPHPAPAHRCRHHPAKGKVRSPLRNRILRRRLKRRGVLTQSLTTPSFPFLLADIPRPCWPLTTLLWSSSSLGPPWNSIPPSCSSQVYALSAPFGPLQSIAKIPECFLHRRPGGPRHVDTPGFLVVILLPLAPTRAHTESQLFFSKTNL